jgi:BASS family bile acid:Na+ symporter
MATSLLLPITLPALVKLLMGHEIEIPFSHMARLLVIIILVPLVAAALIRRFAPALARGLARWQFPLSITCFFIINVAIFGGYSSFLAEHQVELLSALVVSCFLALAYSGLGWLAGVVLGGGMDGITGAVEMTFINNVLIVVFASQFFGPETPLVAAMYLLPVNALIPVLRWVGARSS